MKVSRRKPVHDRNRENRKLIFVIEVGGCWRVYADPAEKNLILHHIATGTTVTMRNPPSGIQGVQFIPDGAEVKPTVIDGELSWLVVR